MAYEDALRLLATAETPKPRDMSDLDYELWLDDLVASKYTYVVASQARRRVSLGCSASSDPRMTAFRPLASYRNARMARWWAPLRWWVQCFPRPVLRDTGCTAM